jgi:hypothetical protein
MSSDPSSLWLWFEAIPVDSPLVLKSSESIRRQGRSHYCPLCVHIHSLNYYSSYDKICSDHSYLLDLHFCRQSTVGSTEEWVSYTSRLKTCQYWPVKWPVDMVIYGRCGQVWRYANCNPNSPLAYSFVIACEELGRCRFSDFSEGIFFDRSEGIWGSKFRPGVWFRTHKLEIRWRF